MHNQVAKQQALLCCVDILQQYFSVFSFAQAALLHSLEGCVYTAASAFKQRQLCHVLSDTSAAPLAGSLLALHFSLIRDDFILREQHSDWCGDKLCFSSVVVF